MLFMIMMVSALVLGYLIGTNHEATKSIRHIDALQRENKALAEQILNLRKHIHRGPPL